MISCWSLKDEKALIVKVSLKDTGIKAPKLWVLDYDRELVSIIRTGCVRTIS